MFIGNYKLVAQETCSNGLICKYFKNANGTQCFNRDLILHAVMSYLPEKYSENIKLTKSITKLSDIGKHNLKQLVYIDPYVMKNLTAYIQRTPMYKTAEPIVIGVDVYLIKDVFHVRVVKISSRYQTAKNTSRPSKELSLKIPRDHDLHSKWSVAEDKKPVTLGQLVSALVKVQRKHDNLLECVKHIQSTLAHHKVEYVGKQISDIGICNSIEPILYIKFADGHKLEVVANTVNLADFKTLFKYYTVKSVFE